METRVLLHLMLHFNWDKEYICYTIQNLDIPYRDISVQYCFSVRKSN